MFGLAPALQASTPDLVATLKDDIGAGVPRRQPLQSTLVAGQLALSLVALVAAGLFLRALQAARRVDLGFTDAQRVLLVGTDLQLAGVRGDSFQVSTTRRLLDEVRAVPGVVAASLSSGVPLGFGGWSSSGTRIEGYEPRPNENMSIRYYTVAGDYFHAMGTPIVRARDIKFQNLDEEPHAFIYRTYGTTFTPASYTLHILAAGDPAALTSSLRRAFAAVSADLPFLDARTMAQHMQASVFVQKIGATMLTGFGILALLLSAVGIYGTMAYAVSRRVREIGVRVALGAGGRDVVGLIVGRAMRLVAAGLVIGLAAALGVGQLLRGQLLGLNARDPATFATIGIVLGGVALLASWLPARRAARVDPMVALRYE